MVIAMAAAALASAPAIARTGGAKSSSHAAKSAKAAKSPKSPRVVKAPAAKSGNSHGTKPRAAHPPAAGRAPGTGSRHGRSKAVPGVQRDKDGHIARSAQARNDFKRSHPCPSTGKSSGACPGYVIDHVKPLKRGGADSPGNMQWQTTQAAKQKDKVE